MDESQNKMYFLVVVIVGVYDILVSAYAFIVGQWKIGLFYLIVGAMSIVSVLWTIKEYGTFDEDAEKDEDDANDHQ